MPRPTTTRKPRTLMETARVSTEERLLLRRAAKQCKQPRSEFVREAALAQARVVLAAAA